MRGPLDAPNPATNCSYETDEEGGAPWDADYDFPLEVEGEDDEDTDDD